MLANFSFVIHESPCYKIPSVGGSLKRQGIKDDSSFIIEDDLRVIWAIMVEMPQSFDMISHTTFILEVLKVRLVYAL